MLCWSLPPGIWLSGCHLVWRVVASWLLSSLMATKLRPCVRLCPLHHVGGGIRWVSQKPLRTPLKLHAPAFLACCCLLSCLVLLTFPLLIGLAFSLLILMLGPSYSATSAKPEGKKMLESTVLSHPQSSSSRIINSSIDITYIYDPL